MMRCCWKSRPRPHPARPAGCCRWASSGATRPPPPLPTQLALARVRRGAKVGLLTDAFALPGFPLAVLSGLAQKDIIAIERGMIRFEPTSRMAEISVPDDVEMHWISAEQSNSSVIVGDIAIIKMFRRVTDGPHPEAEMGRYLTEQGFRQHAGAAG